ncbi:MAG: hypothetical protein J6T51_01090 [Kiritimatiellae bacterium]|nr:hypothetical protein [Kiritimatiellia bacterium]
MKSKASLVTCAALAAFSMLLPSMCEAITIKAANGKITATRKTKNHVQLKWSAVNGATKYGIIRSTSPSLSTSDINKLKKLKFLKTFGKSTRSYKDTSAKLGYKYYYWYGALVGSTLYYCPIPACGNRYMDLRTNGRTSSGKVWTSATINGKSLPKSGVSYKFTYGGNWTMAGIGRSTSASAATSSDISPLTRRRVADGSRSRLAKPTHIPRP